MSAGPDSAVGFSGWEGGRWARWAGVLVGAMAMAWLAGADLRADTLTIATYNVENYGPANRMTEAGYRKDYPKPEPEKRALREVIRGMRADVLMLQEMGGQAYLDELRRDLKAEGVDYPHAALATAADADRHLAVLSRRPLRAVTTHSDLEFSYFGAKENVKRGLFEVTVSAGGRDLTLFGLHLKSRFTERPDDPLSAVRRAGEATAVRDRVLRRFPHPAEAHFLILGDCNDSRTSRIAAALQKRGKTEIAVLWPAVDSRGEAWTHLYRREESYTRVDMVFVSPGLRKAVGDGPARIYDGPGVREASDHRPVVITLKLE
jgi:endonuclease/exonuclease/phosphatase family metal-dependent hydrolase